jgi:hypothetical protein
MPIIYDTLTLIAEYIDNKTYQQGTLVNSDFYTTMARFNNINVTINARIKKQHKGQNYDIHHNNLNYQMINYAITCKKFDMDKHKIYVANTSNYDLRILELMLSKYDFTAANNNYYCDYRPFNKLLLYAIRNDNRKIMGIISKYKHMPKHGISDLYIEIIKTDNISLLEYFVKLNGVQLNSSQGVISQVLDYSKKIAPEQIKILNIMQMAKIKYNGNFNINLNRGIENNNLSITRFLLKHGEVVGSISFDQLEKLIKLLPKEEIRELFKNKKLLSSVDMKMLIVLAENYHPQFLNTYHRDLIKKQLKVDLLCKSYDKALSNNNELLLNVIDEFSISLLQTFLEKEKTNLNLTIIQRIIDKYCEIPDYNTDYIKAKLSKNIDICLF